MKKKHQTYQKHRKEINKTKNEKNVIQKSLHDDEFTKLNSSNEKSRIKQLIQLNQIRQPALSFSIIFLNRIILILISRTLYEVLTSHRLEPRTSGVLI